MDHKVSFFRILFAVIIINSAGFLLRYFELDTFIILLGFRFHLSFTLPLLFILRLDLLSDIKKILLHPLYKKKSPYFILFFLPAIILAGILFFLFEIKIGDPDYFYELGLSSIADYPIYLAWNFPQGILLLLFLVITSSGIKQKFLYLFFIIPLLFIYEFIPLNDEEINLLNIGIFLLTTLSIILLIKGFQNIYLIPLLFFSLLWLNILAFGTESALLTRMLLANQYNNWDGFFILSKEVSDYILAGHLSIFFITLFISFLFRKKLT